MRGACMTGVHVGVHGVHVGVHGVQHGMQSVVCGVLAWQCDFFFLLFRLVGTVS